MVAIGALMRMITPAGDNLCKILLYFDVSRFSTPVRAPRMARRMNIELEI